MGECNTPIGSNPRRFYGFKSESSVKSHIRKYLPMLGNCVGRVKKLKIKREFRDGNRSDYLVYFKVRKR